MALKLGKYVSLWWANLCAKRIRKRKENIRTWEKMSSKLKSDFLPPSYLEDSYCHLHNLSQGFMNVEDYTRKFEKLFIKGDLQKAEDHTKVRYLGRPDRRYANMVELQQYLTFCALCILGH